MQNYIGLENRFEAQFFYLDAIGAWGQIGNVVASGFIGDRFVADACSGIDSNDFCVWSETIMPRPSSKSRRMNVAQAHEPLIAEEADKLLDEDAITREAIDTVEQNGIVFLDEIDKICARSEFRGGGDVSREGVQRDLLPLIEGTTVATKHGSVKTDHILFIA